MHHGYYLIGLSYSVLVISAYDVAFSGCCLKLVRSDAGSFSTNNTHDHEFCHL